MASASIQQNSRVSDVHLQHAPFGYWKEQDNQKKIGSAGLWLSGGSFSLAYRYTEIQ